MNWLSSLIGADKVLSSPIDAIGNTLDKLFTSDDERAQAQLLLEKLRQHPAELQVELNKVEAQNRSVFIAGWRPFIGYVCGLGLFTSFVVSPWMQWFGFPSVSLPLDAISSLVVALLGLGSLRTVEKAGGLTK